MFNVPKEPGNPHLFVSLLSNCAKNVIRLITKVKKIAEAGSLPSIKCSEGPPGLRLLPNSLRCLNSAQRFDHCALGSNRKLGGAGEHLIDGSEKHICRLSFEF